MFSLGESLHMESLCVYLFGLKKKKKVQSSYLHTEVACNWPSPVWRLQLELT